MNIEEYVNLEKYVYIHAYCFCDVGIKRGSIYNSLEGKFYLFDKSYMNFLEILEDNRICDCFLNESINKDELLEFLTFLFSNNLARLIDDISLFPKLEITWDFPYNVKEAIIDINKSTLHDFAKIFTDLTTLYCHSVEIRFFRPAHLYEIFNIASLNPPDVIQKLIFVLPYDKGTLEDEVSLKKINKLVKDDSRIFFYIHSTPSFSNYLNVSSVNVEYPYLFYNMITFKDRIDDCEHCGNIDYTNFYSIGIEKYMENRLFNGCLNRKISIDENGYIKNCPSMQKIWGHIDTHSLIEVYQRLEFRSIWNIKKDEVNICRDCELKYLCSDCRAYTLKNELYNKPSKCNYDPYAE